VRRGEAVGIDTLYIDKLRYWLVVIMYALYYHLGPEFLLVTKHSARVRPEAYIT